MPENESLEAFEDMLNKFELTQPEGLNCNNGKKIEHMCVNPNCLEVSMTCYDLECSSCKTNLHE